MLSKVWSGLSYANVMATVAVMLALGGTSYAAFNLPDNSVASRNIKDGAVHSQDLAQHAVTGAKVVPNSLGNAAINQATLFKCAPGDAALGNRSFCAFKLTSASGVDWVGAIQMCRARGSTTARLPTAAELAAFAPLGGSPFKCIQAWTADPSSGGTSGPGAWVMQTNSAGAGIKFFSTPLTNSNQFDVACVYSAADVG